MSHAPSVPSDERIALGMPSIRMGAFGYPEPKARVALFGCRIEPRRPAPHGVGRFSIDARVV